MVAHFLLPVIASWYAHATTMAARIVTKGTLWRYPSEKAAWHFLTLDRAARKRADEIASARARKGWGQIAVVAKTGGTSWETSIFPDKEMGWLLPVKASVRRKERIEEGDEMTVRLEIA